MPFTPTHALAILPVKIMMPRLSLSALLIGSIIPDLPLFIPFTVSYWTTHSWMGLLIADLPLGWGVFLLFHFYFREPLTALLPLWVQQRLPMPERPILTLSAVLMISLALLVGAASHVIWDAFTHIGRWGVAFFPVLNERYRLAGLSQFGYKWFQYGSTIIGLPLLMVMTLGWLCRQVPRPVVERLALHQRIGIGSIMLITPILIIAGVLLVGFRGLSVVLGLSAIVYGQVLLVMIATYGLWYWYFEQR